MLEKFKYVTWKIFLISGIIKEKVQIPPLKYGQSLDDPLNYLLV